MTLDDGPICADPLDGRGAARPPDSSILRAWMQDKGRRRRHPDHIGTMARIWLEQTGEVGPVFRSIQLLEDLRPRKLQIVVSLIIVTAPLHSWILRRLK